MILLEEKVVLGGQILHVELDDDLRYSLRFGSVVEYKNGVRKVKNRTSSYEFKSVEKLRYDFERDLAALGVNLG